MTRATIAVGVFVTLLVLLAVGVVFRAPAPDLDRSPPAPVTPSSPGGAPEAHPAPADHQGFLYGRILTVDGTRYQGRLRWGGDEEAFWGDWFNGAQRENPWLAHVPPGRLSAERRPWTIFGIRIGDGEGVARLFMVRFGEIARIEAHGRDVRVTLKNGTAFDLDRLEASDFDDGVRVWDETRGVVDLKSLQVRRIEFLPTPPLNGAPARLQGTVRTRQGEFAGFVGWDWNDSVGSDELDGRSADREVVLRFDTIRSIARRSPDSALVTLLDGRQLELSGSHEIGDGNRGITVDDERYGRVQISWDAFERVEFVPGGSGPGYDDFPPGRALTGTVTTRSGSRLSGRLVYDVDESETVETLDGSAAGVRYTVPLGLVASIVHPRGAEHGTVSFHDGEELRLEAAGDLRPENAGMLVFGEGAERPEYVPWADVARVELDPPAATDPRSGGGG